MWHRWSESSAWCSCGLLRRSKGSVLVKPGRSNALPELADREVTRARLLALTAIVQQLLCAADEGPPEPVGECDGET